MTLDMEIQDMKRRTAIRERKKGIGEGIKKGEKKGKEEGRRERTIEIVRNMRAEGMNDALIAKLTKLSEEEVTALA